MKNEEAKEIIECREMIDAMSERANEALDIAIEALEQEPCEAINRILEQIDKAYAHFESGDTRYGFDICKDIIDRELKKMPTVPPKALEQTRWIPVSERLPYNHEYIQNNGLFNVSDGNRTYSEWFDIYDTQKFGEPTINGFRVDYAVTAWMPLPKPYKAESPEPYEEVQNGNS